MSQALAHAFHQQSRMWRAAISDLRPEHWLAVPDEKMNPLAFQATHLFEIRHLVAGFVGLEVVNPLPADIQQARSAAEIKRWPTPSELLGGWDAVDAPLEAVIAKLDEAFMAEAKETKIPWGIHTKGDMMHFFAHHEAYHLGQMGSLRTALGLPSLMSQLVV